jgi:hypothetical protein
MSIDQVQLSIIVEIAKPQGSKQPASPELRRGVERTIARSQ